MFPLVLVIEAAGERRPNREHGRDDHKDQSYL